MLKNANRAYLAGVLAAVLLLLGPTIGFAAEDEDSFPIGGSCAALAYLNVTELKARLGASFSDDFHSFCFPEEPSECSDYSSLLKGLGRLSTGDDGYHCSLTLAARASTH